MARKCSTLRSTTVKSCQSYFTLCNRNLKKKPYSKPFCTFDNHDFRLKLIRRPFKIAVIMEHTENIPLIIVYELLSKINRNVCNAFFIHCQSWVNSRHLHTIGLVIIEDSCIPLD